jgi:hypothetical protein
MLDFGFLETKTSNTDKASGALAARPAGTVGETGVSAGSGGIQVTLGGFVVGALVGAGVVYAWKEGWYR